MVTLWLSRNRFSVNAVRASYLKKLPSGVPFARSDWLPYCTEAGLIWKIWIENAQTREAGDIYLFTDEAAARAYVEKHTERLKTFGITAIRAKVFGINEGLTQITAGPVG